MIYINSNRFELKYIISLAKRDKIIKEITPYIELDKHIKNNHSYEVRSIYFDSPFGKSYYKKKNGINIRVKFRIRYYPNFFEDINKDYVYIELKKRINENLTKKRIKVPMNNAIKIINNKNQVARDFYKSLSPQNKKILNEIWFHYDRFHLKPVNVICYKRQAYNSKFMPKFRITFDTNVRVRNYNFNLHNGGGSYYIKLPNLCIMEIKFINFIPKWAFNIMQRNNIVRENMSKFISGVEKLDTQYQLTMQKKIFSIID
ncbi:MAG: VTC domain-containing protein [Promethearchaeota archaeon]